MAAERGGADFLLAINAGRIRNMGAPSIACMLPIFDAGPLSEHFAREELLAQCRIPVLLGLNVWAETCDPIAIADGVREAGFAGATNFPTSTHFGRPMRQLLSRAGRGIEREVAVLRAVQDAGLTTMFYFATKTQARLGADAGLDMVCLNLGWNVGGATGHQMRRTVEEVGLAAREIGRLVKRISPSTKFLLEGGPVETAEDLARVAAMAPIDGYVGGSTIERLPLEISVAHQIAAFRGAGQGPRELDARTTRLARWGRDIGYAGLSETLLAFLSRLDGLATGSMPLLILTEPGQDPGLPLRALKARSRTGVEATPVILDVGAEDVPALAARRLFGGGEVSPALADRHHHLLVVTAPERLAPRVQKRLARALREGSFRPSGTRESIEVVPRVILICALAADEVAEPVGLHPDLREVLAPWSLRPPPLRDRADDLPEIIDALAHRAGGVVPDHKAFTPAAMQRLLSHTWPGNEREVERLLGSFAGREAGSPILPEELDLRPAFTPLTIRSAVTEKDLIVETLWRHGFHRTRAADALGISRKTLYNKMRRYGLDG